MADVTGQTSQGYPVVVAREARTLVEAYAAARTAFQAEELGLIQDMRAARLFQGYRVVVIPREATR